MKEGKQVKDTGQLSLTDGGRVLRFEEDNYVGDTNIRHRSWAELWCDEEHILTVEGGHNVDDPTMRDVWRAYRIGLAAGTERGERQAKQEIRRALGIQ